MNKGSVNMGKNVDSPLMQLLISKKKTPEELADALGVNVRSVFFWLSGNRKPRFTIAQVQTLCRFLDCSVHELPIDFSRDSAEQGS